MIKTCLLKLNYLIETKPSLNNQIKIKLNLIMFLTFPFKISQYINPQD